MLFNSLAYVLLVTLVRFFQLLTSKPAFFMLLGSLVFYFFAGLFDTSVFLVSIIVNWLIRLAIPRSRLRIVLAVLFNIGLLVAFKYADFFLGVSGEFAAARSYIDVALPLGISFYTFQILAYQVDVSRGTSKEASSFGSFALFVAFFPQLVAGPIVRSHELLPQVERLFRGDRKRVRLISYGLGLFLLGLFKKVVLADSISPFVDEVFLFGPESAAWAWLGSVLFAFQIYLDFSGYSDMAIGSAYLLGIKLPVNFSTPYLSRGPREFWQRWHITLSHWIRDYVYIPLGGNHGSIVRAGFVVVFTMAVAGLWHGADMTFVIWGAAWGLYIFAGRLSKGLRLPGHMAIAMHFMATVFLWVLFRAPDWDTALGYYQVMLGLKEGASSKATFYEYTGIFPVLAGISVLLFTFHILEARLHRRQTLYRLKKLDGWFLWGFLAGLCFLIILLPRVTANPFIYFRF